MEKFYWLKVQCNLNKSIAKLLTKILDALIKTSSFANSSSSPNPKIKRCQYASHFTHFFGEHNGYTDLDLLVPRKFESMI